MSKDNDPARSKPKEDVGAETESRFAYQCSWTAVHACGVLAPESEIEAVYCEHHEDILVHLKSGQYIGIQVKTRKDGQSPWKSTDSQVVKSLERFAELDAGFPGKFSEFVFASNHTFHEPAKNGKNLNHILELARACGGLPAAKEPLKGYIDKIAEKLAKKLGKSLSDAKNCVLETLKKTRRDNHPPKFASIAAVLSDSIRRAYEPASDSTPRQLEQLASALEHSIRDACSLKCKTQYPAYMDGAADAVKKRDAELIESKRFTKARLAQILQEAGVGQELLHPTDATGRSPATLGTKMTKKLNLGGLSQTSINLAVDLATSANNLLLKWNARLGTDLAKDRYAHIKTLVLKDCASAAEEARVAGDPYGPEMLELLREKLRNRLQGDSKAVFALSEDLLEGCAYELTEQCRVWWSERRQLEETVEDGSS